MTSIGHSGAGSMPGGIGGSGRAAISGAPAARLLWRPVRRLRWGAPRGAGTGCAASAWRCPAAGLAATRLDQPPAAWRQHLRVDLRRGDAGVPQLLLERAQVFAVAEAV